MSSNKEIKAATDWEAIEKSYRAGILSIREIAKAHSISDTAIRQYAKSHGWERDLTERVNAKVRTELVRSSVRTADPQTESQIIEEAAATVVQVVRSHRSRITQGNALVELLTNQLIDVAGKRDEFEAEIEVLCADDTNNNRRGMLMKAVSLEKHAQIAVNLSNATKVWVGLERQAFGIKEEVSGTGAHEAGLDDLA